MILSKLMRGFVAVLVAFSMMFATIAQPVLADPISPNADQYPVNITINQGDNSSVTFGESTRLSANDPIHNFLDGVIRSAEVMAGGVAFCYAVDGLATTVFPPAAAFAALCPVMPTLAGGTVATKTAISVVKAL